MDSMTVITVGAIGLVAVALGSLLLMSPAVAAFGPFHDLKESYKPTGKETTAVILSNADGCLFEVDGERQTSHVGFFIEESCPYLVGENVTVYETNGGWWVPKGLVEDGN